MRTPNWELWRGEWAVAESFSMVFCFEERNQSLKYLLRGIVHLREVFFNSSWIFNEKREAVNCKLGKEFSSYQILGVGFLRAGTCSIT